MSGGACGSGIAYSSLQPQAVQSLSLKPAPII